MRHDYQFLVDKVEFDLVLLKESVKDLAQKLRRDMNDVTRAYGDELRSRVRGWLGLAAATSAASVNDQPVQLAV